MEALENTQHEILTFLLLHKLLFPLYITENGQMLRSRKRLARVKLATSLVVSLKIGLYFVENKKRGALSSFIGGFHMYLKV
jgi:hypothetical protein